MSAQFHSLDELLAHTKGTGWNSIKSTVEDEYEALEYIGQLPNRQRLSHPLLQYEEDLGCFYHFLSGGPGLPEYWHVPRRAGIRKKLEQIREEEGGAPPP
ncbi:MAG TPA: hypothetical protein VFA77_01630 [Candidatus Eisenbacteria bacterium]|jgi:hypothetical protein|nr:hypothetical protein [Candidatus Eisenbacteria bacterium]